MYKISTIILALFILASNLIPAYIFANVENNITVSATVLESLSFQRFNNNIKATNNLKKNSKISKIKFDNKLYDGIFLEY
jgi:hypothetical protein